MTSPTNHPVCRVSGADKLPADLGGADALCQAIEEALGNSAVDGPISVEVIVRSQYAMAANIKRAGQSLPELTMDSSDRVITPGSIRHFAEGIAQAAASGS